MKKKVTKKLKKTFKKNQRKDKKRVTNCGYKRRLCLSVRYLNM
jgi:hypothetical protein